MAVEVEVAVVARMVMTLEKVATVDLLGMEAMEAMAVGGAVAMATEGGGLVASAQS